MYRYAYHYRPKHRPRPQPKSRLQTFDLRMAVGAGAIITAAGVIALILFHAARKLLVLIGG